MSSFHKRTRPMWALPPRKHEQIVRVNSDISACVLLISSTTTPTAHSEQFPNRVDPNSWYTCIRKWLPMCVSICLETCQADVGTATDKACTTFEHNSVLIVCELLNGAFKKCDGLWKANLGFSISGLAAMARLGGWTRAKEFHFTQKPVAFTTPLAPFLNFLLKLPPGWFPQNSFPAIGPPRTRFPRWVPQEFHARFHR